MGYSAERNILPKTEFEMGLAAVGIGLHGPAAACNTAEVVGKPEDVWFVGGSPLLRLFKAFHRMTATNALAAGVYSGVLYPVRREDGLLMRVSEVDFLNAAADRDIWTCFHPSLASGLEKRGFGNIVNAVTTVCLHPSATYFPRHHYLVSYPRVREQLESCGVSSDRICETPPLLPQLMADNAYVAWQGRCYRAGRAGGGLPMRILVWYRGEGVVTNELAGFVKDLEGFRLLGSKQGENKVEVTICLGQNHRQAEEHPEIFGVSGVSVISGKIYPKIYGELTRAFGRADLVLVGPHLGAQWSDYGVPYALLADQSRKDRGVRGPVEEATLDAYRGEALGVARLDKVWRLLFADGLKSAWQTLLVKNKGVEERVEGLHERNRKAFAKIAGFVSSVGS